MVVMAMMVLQISNSDKIISINSIEIDSSFLFSFFQSFTLISSDGIIIIGASYSLKLPNGKATQLNERTSDQQRSTSEIFHIQNESND